MIKCHLDAGGIFYSRVDNYPYNQTSSLIQLEENLTLARSITDFLFDQQPPQNTSTAL